ncbi:hypothetical protein ASG99_16525 [Bacillus sp. Soil768D1]|nr:hypothetical protein ASG99_16525 [Bacillus sp. Soil768D1]
MPTTASKLVEEFKVSKRAISQMIHKLEQDGCIYRKPNPNNKKENLLYPTPKGILYQKGIENLDNRMVEKYYIHMNLDEIQQMYDLVNKFNTIIRKNR